MYLFGPATVSYGGLVLGDTKGGVSFTFNEKEQFVDCIGETVYESWVTHVRGVVHKLELESFSVLDSLVRSSGRDVMVVNGNGYVASFYNCLLLFPKEMVLGVNEQRSFDLRFNCTLSAGITKLFEIV